MSLEKEPLKSRRVHISEAKKVVGLKSMGFKDYTAARKLLLEGFLHQAAFLINTCIEKELKAYLFAHGIKTNILHESSKLLNVVSEIDGVEWTKEINAEFIKVITKIYRSRYFENLSPGFNFVINRNKFLAELDFTYSLLESKSQFSSDGININKTKYHHCINSKDPILYQENYILNNIKKSDFLNRPDVVYEFRVAQSHHIVEMQYSITANSDHRRFNYEGLKQLSNQQFELSQGNDQVK